MKARIHDITMSDGSHVFDLVLIGYYGEKLVIPLDRMTEEAAFLQATRVTDAIKEAQGGESVEWLDTFYTFS